MTKFIARINPLPEIVFLIFVLLFLQPVALLAQDTINLNSSEEKLATLCNKIWKMKDDSSRLAVNAEFGKEYQSVLNHRSAYEYPFDSLTGISRLKSADGKVRISTWNVPLVDGSFRYFGFIETKDGKLYQLQESATEPHEWNNKIVSADQWYGAVYYKLITLRYHNEDLYTLLGWDGNDHGSNIKLIDILSFTTAGIPEFGKPVFKNGAEIRNRIIVEYSEKAFALLRYDYQSIMVQKQNRLKEKKSWMIVTDRLVPPLPTMEGIHKFYVPSGDLYDAYVFIKGFWTFVENVKVVNTPR